jgi:hypothetical protein
VSDGLKLSRLRAGEMIAGAGGVLLLASGARSRSGWPQLPVLRGLSLVTGISAVLLVYFQARRRAPALPASLSVVVTTLGALSTTALAVRVLLAPSKRTAAGSTYRFARAYVGLCGALAIAYGGYASMRQEGGTDPAALGEIETVSI